MAIQFRLYESEAKYLYEIRNLEHLKNRALDYAKAYRHLPHVKESYEQMAIGFAERKVKKMEEQRDFIVKTIQEFLVAMK